jgi:hypothetical protein
MLPDTDFLERVNHHLGNGGQILQFYKGTSPELDEALSHIVKAKEILTRYINEESTVRIHDDTKIAGQAAQENP